MRTPSRPLAVFPFLYILFLSISEAHIPTAAAQAMPHHAATLMQLAPEVNGLNAPSVKPWHIKATYQTYDDKGKLKDQGALEEWWAAPDKDKRVYSSATFNQTDYITSAGKFRVGDENGPPLAEFLVRERLIDPMPDKADMDGAVVRMRDSPFPKSKLTCTELARPLEHEFGSPVGLFPTYCFEVDKPMLRFSGSFGLLNTLYTQVGQLDGHYLGVDIQIMDRGKPFATVHLAQGNLLSEIHEADFVPPANAVALPNGGSAKVEAKVLGRKIGGSSPTYPASAKQAHIEGTVTLSVLIGEDGHIRQVRVMSAPDPALALASLEAVRDWVYTPYQLNGHPVEVSTQIKVIYRLLGG
jgi:TonB family protein